MRPNLGRLSRIRAKQRYGDPIDIPLLEFDSFQEAVTASMSDYEVTHGGGHARKSSFRYADIQTRTFDEAIQLAQKGWPEGLKKAEGMAKQLDVTGRIAKPEIVYDVVGNCGFDMGRFVTGDPECVMDWRESEEATENSMRGKVIHLVFNISASCGVEGEVLVRRGAAAMELIDALETAGRRVEVTIIEQCEQFEYRIIAKNAHQHLQMDQLAFATMHPSMLRRIGFSLTALCGEEGLQATKWNYGSPASRPFGDIYMPAAHMDGAQWHSDASAIKWVLRMLKEQGVELEMESYK